MEGPLSSRWPMIMLALSIGFDIWKYLKSPQGSLCCLSAGESDSCCIALQVTWLFYPLSLFCSLSLHFTLQTCDHLWFMLWSTEIPVSHVQVTEISCIDWNPWYFRAFINSYFLLGPEPQPAPDSPPPPSPARFEQPLSLHLAKYYLYCFWQPMGARSASVGRSQPLVGRRSWGLGWTRDVSDLEIQTKVRVIFHQQKLLQCT